MAKNVIFLEVKQSIGLDIKATQSCLLLKAQLFLVARAPLELAHVKKKENFSNSDKLLSPASTCTPILDT